MGMDLISWFVFFLYQLKKRTEGIRILVVIGDQSRFNSLLPLINIAKIFFVKFFLLVICFVPSPILPSHYPLSTTSFLIIWVPGANTNALIWQIDKFRWSLDYYCCSNWVTMTRLSFMSYEILLNRQMGYFEHFFPLLIRILLDFICSSSLIIISFNTTSNRPIRESNRTISQVVGVNSPLSSRRELTSSVLTTSQPSFCRDCLCAYPVSHIWTLNNFVVEGSL